jgi:hypothetical protein
MVGNRLIVSGIPETYTLSEFTVYDICGRCVLKSQCGSGRTESALNLPSGVYLVVLTCRGQSLMREILVTGNNF